MNNFELVATGDRWVGYGVRSSYKSVNDLIKNAKNEIVMTAYTITDGEIVNNLESALNRGISVEIYLDSPDKSRKSGALNKILSMAENQKHLKIHKISEDVLHAKVVVTDSRKSLIGSANLTFSGMVNNYELGFLIDDEHTAQKVLSLIRKLIRK